MSTLSKRDIFRRLITDCLREEHISVEVRFDGLILAMKAHHLPCPPERVQEIRKQWLACVAKRQPPGRTR